MKTTFFDPQYDHFMLKAVTGQEDCLVLSVYVPGQGEKRKDLLPVMFFIHGGAFFVGSGSSDLFGPERFLDYDVVSKAKLPHTFDACCHCIGSHLKMNYSLVYSNKCNCFENT